VALAAATPKTVLAVKAGATFGLDIRKWGISFNGVTASAVPVLVELMFYSGATAGTATANTPFQIAGYTIAHGCTAGQAYTVEPTVLTAWKTYLVTPNGGMFVEEFSADISADSGAGAGVAIRCTAPAIVSCRAILEWSRN
jgi:hypothetical protein